MFKKVIGQEPSGSQKPSLTHSDDNSASRSAPAPSNSRPAPSSSNDRPSNGNTRNVLSSDVEIKGTVKFKDDLIVDGKIEGDIQSTGNLTVGENARLKAEIKTGTVVVYGKVHGNMTASDRVELKSSAEVIGDIKAQTLTIDAGAIFVGKSTVGTPSQGAGQRPDEKKSQTLPSDKTVTSPQPASAK